MKQLMAICLVCMLTTAASLGAIAPTTITINFDENGNGSWQSPVGGGTLGWGMGVPTQAGTADQYETLYYVLPGTVVEGDLILEYGPDAYYSDVLRFVNEQGATGALIGRVYVYSDSDPGTKSNDLADNRLPYDYLRNSWGMFEQGTEDGWNGIKDYTPWYSPDVQGYAPGFMSNATVTYNFTSDVVPEPATIGLLGLGALGLLRKRRA